MAELSRGPALRLVAGAALLALGLSEAQSLRATAQAHARLRERAVREAALLLEARRPVLAPLLHPGGPASWNAALREAALASPVAEVEVFDSRGHALTAVPSQARLRHWPAPREMERLERDRVLAVGPVVGEAVRILAYGLFDSGDQRVVLRLAFPAPDLVEDLRDRRWAFVFEGVALVALLFAGALALVPARRGDLAPAGPRALHAYEEAMERLRTRGDALSRQQHERVRALEERVADREALARAGELTAGMVHEVRNGLGTIVGWARLAERDPAQAPEAGRLIREECETLEGVVRRFVEFVKRESLSIAAVDVRRLLERVAAREGRSPGAAVTVAAPAGTEVRGDEALLERALENLVRNAREAAGPSGQVWLEAAATKAAVVITVADDGPGLPEEAGQGIRPFFTTRPGGLGLGLPLALKLVVLHGGRLGLESRKPRGTIATVTLPRDGPPPDSTVTDRSDEDPEKGE